MEHAKEVIDYSTFISKWLNNSYSLPTTKKQYEAQVNLFFKEYKKLSIQNVIDFIQKGQGESRCYHRKYAIKSYLQYLKQMELITLNEYLNYLDELKTVKYKVKDRKEVDTLLLDELEHLIKNIKDEQLRLILMIEFDTAARIRAIIKLRIGDVREFQGKKALFMREKKEKTALKIITDQTYEHLLPYLKGTKNKYLFIDSQKITPDLLDETYYELWKKLKTESRNILGKEISFHWIRRGAGVYWYEKTGKDIVFVKELLNHESPNTTAKYLKLEGEKVREKMKEEKRNW